MCKDCGCGLPGESAGGTHTHAHEHEHESHAHHHPHHEHDPAHEHEHAHTHPHSHDHGHPHAHEGAAHDHEGETRRLIEVRQSLLAKNERLAERNRGFFQARGLLVLNVLSSPGSGKTTFLQQTLRTLNGQLKAAVIVGDLATDNDAQRLRQTGAPVVQITTGTLCHLEAEMVNRALRQVNLSGADLLFIENVGNLVCPASYDLGEDLRIVLLSVTEGEDKPLKYPPMFQAADVVIISKIDLAEPCGWDRELLLANLRHVAPGARVFETSAKTGLGMDAWRQYLVEKCSQRKAADSSMVKV